MGRFTPEDVGPELAVGPMVDAGRMEEARLQAAKEQAARAPADPTFSETIGAKIETEAPVLRRRRQADTYAIDLNVEPDVNFNPYTDPRIPPQYHKFMDKARNYEHAQAIIHDVQREENARQVIENSSTAASLAASGIVQLVDPLNLATNIIPIGRVGKGIYTAGQLALKGAARIGAESGLGQVVQEAALHAEGSIKSWDESAIDIAAAAVIGSVLGGVTSGIGARMTIKKQHTLVSEAATLLRREMEVETGIKLPDNVSRKGTREAIVAKIGEVERRLDGVMDEPGEVAARQEARDVLTEVNLERRVLEHRVAQLEAQGKISVPQRIASQVDNAGKYLTPAQISEVGEKAIKDLSFDETVFRIKTASEQAHSVGGRAMDITGVREHLARIDADATIDATAAVEMKSAVWSTYRAGMGLGPDGVKLYKQELRAELKALREHAKEVAPNLPSLKRELNKLNQSYDAAAASSEKIDGAGSTTATRKELQQQLSTLAKHLKKADVVDAAHTAADYIAPLQHKYLYGDTAIFLRSDIPEVREVGEMIGHTQRRSKTGRPSFNDLESTGNSHLATTKEQINTIIAEGKKKGSRLARNAEEVNSAITDVVEARGVVPDALIAKYGPDDAMIPLLQRAANVVSKFMKKYELYARELGHEINPDLSGAYMTHIPNVERWAEGRVQLDKDLEVYFTKQSMDKEIAATGGTIPIDNMKHNIIGKQAADDFVLKYSRDHEENILGRKANPFGERTSVPLDILRPYLVRDVFKVLNYYNNTAVKRLNLERSAGETVGSFQESAIYKTALDKLRALSLEDGGNSAKYLKEIKELKKAMQNIQDQIWGKFAEGDVLGFASNMAAKLAGIAQLPYAALANLQEIGGVIMIDGFGAALKALGRESSAAVSAVTRAERKAMMDLGAAADVMNNEYQYMVSGTYDYRFGRDFQFVLGDVAAVVEKGMDKAYNKFMTYAGMPFVSKENKILGTRIVEQKLIRLSDEYRINGWDNLGKDDLQWLTDINFDEGTLHQFTNMYARYGTQEEHKALNFGQWTDEARTIEELHFVDRVKAGFAREVEAFAQTGRVGETPEIAQKLAGSPTVSRMIFAYTRFMWHVWNNVVRKGWDRNKTDFYMTMFSTAGLAWAALEARWAMQGQLPRDPEEKAFEVARQLGPIAVPMMIVNASKVVETAVSDTYRTTLQTLERFPVPAVSYGAKVASVAKQAMKGKWNGQATHDLVKVFPVLGGFASLPYIQPITREAANLVNEIFGYESWDELQIQKQKRKDKFKAKDIQAEDPLRGSQSAGDF